MELQGRIGFDHKDTGLISSRHDCDAFCWCRDDSVAICIA